MLPDGSRSRSERDRYRCLGSGGHGYVDPPKGDRKKGRDDENKRLADCRCWRFAWHAWHDKQQQRLASCEIGSAAEMLGI